MKVILSIVILSQLILLTLGYRYQSTSRRRSSSSSSRSRSLNRYQSTKSIDVINEEEISKTKPSWAGKDDPLSNFVNFLISIKPLFNIMKFAARKTLIDTAEKKGIPWSERATVLQDKIENLEQIYKSICSNEITTYPKYYTQEFHAYDEGNLNWKAAIECESATMSMALRVWPDEQLTYIEAQDRLRLSFLDNVKKYIIDNKAIMPSNIVDVGCSVGVSTFYLSDYFKDSNIEGLDLSANFLTIAKLRQDLVTDTSSSSINFTPQEQDVIEASILKNKFSNSNVDRIKWIHANAEKIPQPNNKYDLTAVSFMFHELPSDASDDILKELYRVTAPGGVIAITDNNPQSKVIQNLPPVLFTLMKSTEPWSDEYYVYDIESRLRSLGGSNVITVESDPRHRTILCYKPLPAIIPVTSIKKEAIEKTGFINNIKSFLSTITYK